MTEQTNVRLLQPTITSVEGDLFDAIIGFHKKIMALLRDSSLDEQKLNLVASRIKILLDNTTAEMKLTKQLNVTERLEAAYEEAKRLVGELSKIPDGGKDDQVEGE